MCLLLFYSLFFALSLNHFPLSCPTAAAAGALHSVQPLFPQNKGTVMYDLIRPQMVMNCVSLASILEVQRV